MIYACCTYPHYIKLPRRAPRMVSTSLNSYSRYTYSFLWISTDMSIIYIGIYESFYHVPSHTKIAFGYQWHNRSSLDVNTFMLWCFIQPGGFVRLYVGYCPRNCLLSVTFCKNQAKWENRKHAYQTTSDLTI